MKPADKNLDVEATGTIDCLKDIKIQDQVNIPPDQERLIGPGRPTESGRKL